MAANSGSSKSLILTLGSLGLILVLLYTANTVDFLSGLTRPLVVLIIRLFGFSAGEHADFLQLGHLHVPWTGDCAGLNIFAILLAVTLWSYRNGPFDGRFWLRLILIFPLAFLANLARIFTLIGLRWWLYPATESAQLHYFIGFLWVLPVLGLLLRRPAGTPRMLFILEILRIAALLSLLAPFVSAPGGLLVSACSLILLARCDWKPVTGWLDVLLYAGWMAAGFFIASARMESLWIPWLLVCPGFLPAQPLRWLTLLWLLPGTVPLFAMGKVAPFLLVPGIVIEVWLMFRGGVSHQSKNPGEAPLLAVVALFQIFPFLAALGAATGQPPWPPPVGTMSYRAPDQSWVVRVIGQPPDLRIFWYDPDEGGRHHTLQVCLQYRGHNAKPTSDGRVLEYEGDWLTEFFLMPDGRLIDYKEYLRATFWPFTSSGVHVIASMPQGVISDGEFRALAEESVQRLAEIERASRGIPTSGAP